ncbi:MAG TPA: sigma 54-interacting transcriptional regulator, partial [Kofleriaceae bacterium]|nr:sigma 54-interacting transcriptional regulator [Kofleriaceae bacterium]
GGVVRVIAAPGGTTVSIGGADVTDVELGPLAPGEGVPITLSDRVVLVLHLVEREDAPETDAMGMVGQGAGIRALRRAIAQVVDLQVPVLIRGETGTGKELVARALHQRGPRQDGPFVSVNLGAIPRELAAAELFGAVRGAYSGATRDRAGYFRAAAGGTLFLDEVGEAPPEVQVMLLRVLESRELYPVGSHEPVATDVRLIAATDADLDAQMVAGRFKAALLHRLAGHQLHLPPLRARIEDIGPLFHHFAREELAAIGEAERLDPDAPRDPRADPWLPAAIATRLLRFRWPGNVRQLRNVTRQLVIGSRGRAQLQLDARLQAELDAGAMPVAMQAAVRAAPPAPPRRESSSADVTRPSQPTEEFHAISRASLSAHDTIRPDAARALDLAVPGGADESDPARRLASGRAGAGAEREPAARRRPSEVTEPEVIAALRGHGWDLKAAADALGIPRSSIYDVIDRCPNIRTAGDLTPAEIERCYQACEGDLDRMAASLEVSRRALQRRVKELGLEVARRPDR